MLRAPVEIDLDVRTTIKKLDGHLHCWARSSVSGKLATRDACVVADSSYGETPATDICLAFVLWADSSFKHMPLTLKDAITYCRDPVEGERKIAERNRMLEISRQQYLREKLERQARLEESLRIKTVQEDEWIRLNHLGWRELMDEQSSDLGDDSLSAVFARGIREVLLRPGPGESLE